MRLTDPTPLTHTPEGTARGTHSDPVAEIVTFRLGAGADPEAFAKAAEGLTPFLAATGAVLSRTLSRDDDGFWTDHIVWTSRAAAEDAARRIQQEPAAAPFMGMIDPGTVSLSHAAIRFQS